MWIKQQHNIIVSAPRSPWAAVLAQSRAEEGAARAKWQVMETEVHTGKVESALTAAKVKAVQVDSPIRLTPR